MSRIRTLLVRCDVGPEYGVGHLMRCVALAEEFAGRGFEVVFSADAESVPFAREQLLRRGFRWVRPPDTVEELVVQARAADVVVLDSYVLPPAAYAAVRRAAPTLAVVDGDPAGKDGDVLVDQNIGAEHDDWPLPDGTVRLAGLEHALMRDEIRDARVATPGPGEPGEPGEPAPEGRPAVFAFFGGTDAFGAAPVVTRALVTTGAPFDLRVVGASERLRAELAEIVPGRDQRVTVIEPTSALASEVVGADVVLSAAGTSSWELLCLGAACAFVCVADNQVVSYERVVTDGAVAGLGRLEELRGDPSAAVEALGRLLRDEAARAGLRRAGSRLVDGRGRERVVDALLAHVQSS